MSLVVRAPLAGRVVAIEDVPDPVFSGGLVGPGLAIDPDRDGGAVTAVVSPEGRGVLVHLGLDTVRLSGEGFAVHAAEGSAVAVGDPVVTWSPTRIEARGYDPIVPVVALEAEKEALTTARAGEALASGAAACTWA